MIVKKVQFTMVFGQALEGFAMTPDTIDYYPGCMPPDTPVSAAGAEIPVRPAQEFELTLSEINGQLKGILKSEHGCQKIDDLVESDFSLSFTAFAGSQGVEVFRFVLMFSDSTAQVVGFTCGIKPFFRSFMPLCGRILEQ
jgi:hypothetical protein